MFHVNTENGVSGPCRAEKGNCPFGTPDDHFPTQEAAEAHYEKMMSDQTFVAHTKQPSMPEENSVEAKRSLLQKAIHEAFSEEGQAKFERLESQAAPGSRQKALYRHILAEADKIRIASMDAGEIQAMLHEPSSELVPVNTSALVQTPRPDLIPTWSNYDRGVHMGSSYIQDMVSYDSRLEALRQAGSSATPEQVEDGLPAMRAYDGLSMPRQPTGASLMTWDEWTPISKAADKYSEGIAQELMSHPSASPHVFEEVAKTHGETTAILHPACPLAVKEDILAKKRSKIDPETLPHYRDEQLGSNRIALYMAAYDTDTENRANAFNQVMVSGMETFTKEDRLWLAGNLHRLPTSEITTRTLKDSLRSYALGHTDEAERSKLLELVTDPPEEKPERRGLFRRGSDK